jgi:hypothetical protein
MILWISSLVFVPVFFFASQYAQISLDEPPLKASLVLMYFFLGFVALTGLRGGRQEDEAADAAEAGQLTTVGPVGG